MIMAKEQVNVGVIGAGVVGGGVVKVLMESAETIGARTGTKIALKKVADLDRSRLEEFGLPDDATTTDASQILVDPDIDIVVELIGGESPAKEFILEAFKNGKSVVTANKMLLAKHGPELARGAAAGEVGLKFEASVAGGIPIIKSLSEALVANRFDFIFGILNGTANYILTQMAENGKDFSEALEDAQAKGFAEADPTLDIEGHDAAHKTLIIASLAYATEIDFSDVYVEGITRISDLDVQYADDLGHVIKLLGIIKDDRDTGELEVRVHPTLIPKNYLLASVKNEFNAIYVRGDVTGTTMYYGKGAGRFPTASAVVSDIVDLAKDIRFGSVNRVPPFVFGDRRRIRDIMDIECRYYLRLTALDRPGVLGQISTILGEHHVSIDSVIQKPVPKGKDVAAMVMMTHRSRERGLRAAISTINALDCVTGEAMVIRVE